MSTIVTIQSSDLITNSRADLNTNFSNLNSDKFETSNIDTDTTLAANSDTKVASQKAVKAYVDAGGNVNASTTTRGIVEEATSAEIIAGTAAGGTGARLFINPTAVAQTGNDKIVKTNSSGLLDPSIVSGLDRKVGVGSVSNTTYENYQILFGNAASADFGWTSIGAPTYAYTHLVTGSATGAFRLLPVNIAGGGFFDSTKTKIFEWDAMIAADITTGTSAMGIGTDSTTAGYQDSQNQETVAFVTNASGAWFAHTSRDSTHFTSTSITTPSPGRHNFRIEYIAATPSALFYVDGVLVATLNTSANMPSTNNQTIYMIFANGTTATIISHLSAINAAFQK